VESFWLYRHDQQGSLGFVLIKCGSGRVTLGRQARPDSKQMLRQGHGSVRPHQLDSYRIMNFHALLLRVCGAMQRSAFHRVRTALNFQKQFWTCTDLDGSLKAINLLECEYHFWARTWADRDDSVPRWRGFLS